MSVHRRVVDGGISEPDLDFKKRRKAAKTLLYLLCSNGILTRLVVMPGVREIGLRHAREKMQRKRKVSEENGKGLGSPGDTKRNMTLQETC